MRHVLFICSANYYRSRFAEAVFNHEAARRLLTWRAFSRGLATHLVFGMGDLSGHTRSALAMRSIPMHHTGAAPAALELADLERADRVIALKEAEHRPMMHAQFPEWEDRIEYWHVHDVDAAEPETAIPDIEQRVTLMLDELAPARPKSTRGSRKS